MKTLIQRLRSLRGYTVKNVLNDIFLNLYFKTLPSYVAYNMNDRLAEVIYKHLKAFFDAPRHGYFSGEWANLTDENGNTDYAALQKYEDEAQAELLWTFYYLWKEEDEEHDKLQDEWWRLRNAEFPDGDVLNGRWLASENPETLAARDKLNERDTYLYERSENGLRLFAKVFQGLWD